MAKTSKVKEKKEGQPEKPLGTFASMPLHCMGHARPLYGLRLTPETMAFSGCSITSGLGRGLVTDTGMNTRSPSQSSAACVASAAGILRRSRGIGRIAKLIAGEEPQRLAEAALLQCHSANTAVRPS